MEELSGRPTPEHQNSPCAEPELSNFMCHQKIPSDTLRELKSMHALEGTSVVHLECRSKLTHNRDAKVQADELTATTLPSSNTQRETKRSHIPLMYRHNELKQKRRNRSENLCSYSRHPKNRPRPLPLPHEPRCCPKRSELQKETQFGIPYQKVQIHHPSQGIDISEDRKGIKVKQR